MTHTPAWRNFRRLVDAVTGFAVLASVGSGLHAWRVVPADRSYKLVMVVAAPMLFLALAALFPLCVPPVRKALSGYVWKSFTSGFGQTPRSVLSAFILPAAAALLVLAQIQAAEQGGRYPAAALAAYAAGVGVLLTQSILARLLERDPDFRRQIET